MIKIEYALSEQAQLAIVSLFQKAIVTMKDVSNILQELRVVINELSEVEFSNANLCELSEKDLEEASLQVIPSESYKTLA